MKKFIVSAFVLGGLTLTNAQSGFGVKAGVNFANLRGEDVGNTDMKLGFNVGLTYEFEISDKFNIQPELMYSVQGTKIKEIESTVDYNSSSEIKFNLGYINLPVMFKYLPNDRLFLEAGPQIGFNINAEVDYKDVITEMNNDTPFTESAEGSQDIKDLVNTIEFGLGFGLGYEFVENIGVSSRYVFGLSSAFDDDIDDIKVHNSVLQIGAFYKF